jgi:hypothetical protein
MKTKIAFLSLSGSLAISALPAVANACSVCWGGDTGPVADAFNLSVLFLMAAPYAVMGSIAGGLFWAYRRSAIRLDKSEAVQPLVSLVFNPEESGR